MSVFYLFNSILLLHTIKKNQTHTHNFYCDTKHIVESIDPVWVINSSEFSAIQKKKTTGEEEGEGAEGGETILTQTGEEEYFTGGGEEACSARPIKAFKMAVFFVAFWFL